MEQTVGIAAERDLSSFHWRSFIDWIAARDGTTVPVTEATRKALLVPDPYTSYSHPHIGEAAVRVLEAAGVHVRLPDDVSDSDRPAFSESMLNHARGTAEENVNALAPHVRDGWDVVIVEPSDTVMFQYNYLDLLSGDAIEAIADTTYGVLEYIDVHDIDFSPPTESLVYRGHCHQKPVQKDHHTVGVLRRAGYEAEHLSMSRAIGDIPAGQVRDSTGAEIVAPGASCRSQLDSLDLGDEMPPHPVEKVAAAL